MSVRELADAVMAAVGRHPGTRNVERPIDDPQRRRPDLRRARELGGEPTTPLAAGLEQTVAWYRRQHPDPPLAPG